MLSRRPVVETPGPDARARAQRLLAMRFGPSRVLVGEQECAEYARDESEAEPRTPDAVVLAESYDDVVNALKVAEEAGVPLTPRAGGTGRTGGAVPVAGGIVLATRGLASVVDVDTREGLAVVQPGVVLGALHRTVEAEGWFFPPDANSLDACCLGGNVAENAGGPRAFKYGVTRDYVLGVDAFLMGGRRLRTGRRTRKGVTGYDLVGLLVGSEGTLAVFGDVTLRLVPRPPSVMTLLALFRDVHGAGRAVEEVVAAGLVPRCIELLDAGTLAAVRAAGNAIDPRAGALLLLEVDGEEAECLRQAERVADGCERAKALDVQVARDEGQRERLWAARRAMSGAVRRMARHKLSEDVVVPRRAIGALLRRVEEQSSTEGVRTLTYGHAGDGNLHVNFLWDHAEEVPRVDRCIERLFRDTVELGGTLSGEHGIGVLKAPYLPLEQSPALIELQRELKRVFDPAGLLNPGKIFPAPGHRAC